MAEDFVIRIKADDAATATVKKIQAALGKITEPVDKAQKRLGSLGSIGQKSVSRLTQGINTAARAAGSLVDKVVELVPGLAAIGGVASIAGVAALATKFGSFGFALNRSSKLLGMNAQDLAAWHVAAKRAGVSADQFDSAMSGSQMTIRAAAFGADPQAMMLLNKMGVQIQRNKDGTIDYYTTQMRLIKAIQGQKTVEAQRSVADSFNMGGLLPMLQQGTYDADKARAMRKGLVPTPAEIARASQFKQDINDLEDSVTGLGNSIGSRLVPILDPVVNGFAKWLDNNRANIADKLSEAVQKFVDWISKINWDDVASKAKTVWDNIGGIKGVLIAVAAIKLAGPIASVLSLIASIGTLTTVTIPAASVALRALAMNPVAAAVLSLTHSKDLNQGEDEKLAEVRKKEQWAQAHGGWRPEMMDPNWSPPADDRSSGSGAAAAPEKKRDAPLGIRSNNPLNLLRNGKERIYSTPEEGIAAAVRNLERGYQGLTLAGIVDKWTGGARTGNTPEQMRNYVGILSGATGLGATEKPDLSDAAVVTNLIKAHIRAENGVQPYTDQQIAAGVGAGMSTSTPGTDARSSRLAQSQKQAVEITVTHQNAPQGMTATAQTQDGNYLPTRVSYRLDGI
ncbi:hypothetical protein ACQUFY_10750 [Robbsia andropogonis]|uniref:hypothetical protein n=1 Tax=Robbsia andropogonis TaxID=28092 RepID=UPI003D20CFF2